MIAQVVPNGRFTHENIRRLLSEFEQYEKRTPVRAVKIEGEFSCDTVHGHRTSRTGYLAIDSEGFPYPIDKVVFNATYVKVEEKDDGS